MVVRMMDFCFKVNTEKLTMVQSCIASVIQISLELILYPEPRSLITFSQKGKKFRLISLKVGVEIMMGVVSIRTLGFLETIKIKPAYKT